jgi:hypothetical protein
MMETAKVKKKRRQKVVYLPHEKNVIMLSWTHGS